MAASTRAKTSCPIYGSASDLPSNQLSTVGNAMQFYLQKRCDLPKTTPASQIENCVAKHIVDVWIKAEIPTASLSRVQQKLASVHHEL